MRRFPPNDIISLVEAVPRFDLAESIGPNLQLADVDPEIRSPFGELSLAYGTPAGDPRLRAQIARRYEVSPEEVVVTVGAMHALFLTAFVTCSAGDEVIVTTPIFPLTRNTLEAVGAKVKTWPVSFDAGYQPDCGVLRPLLSRGTQLVSLASPQNPSGVLIPLATIRAILAIMSEICPEAHLLVDETYREATFGNQPVPPTAVGLDPRVISTASLSKCHGAPGLRLGWAITRDAQLRGELVTGKFNTIVSCSALDEALGLRLLESGGQLMSGRQGVLEQGLEQTAGWVRDNARFVEWIRPDGGALCCVRLKRTAFDDEAVGRFYAALPRAGVRVAPGTWFGEEERVFRLGFGAISSSDLDAALAALTKVLKESAYAQAA